MITHPFIGVFFLGAREQTRYNNSMSRVIIFDFDGPIVDSFLACFEMGEFRSPGITLEEYRMMFTGNIFDEFEKRQQGKPVIEPPDFDYGKESQKRKLPLTPVQGIPELLKNLHTKAHILAIISSSNSERIREYLRTHHIEEFFTDVLGADVEKSKVRKFEMVAQKYNVSPDQMIFVTDTLGDIKEAAEHNIPTIGVTWGFHDKTLLRQGNPHAIVSTPKALEAAIENLLV